MLRQAPAAPIRLEQQLNYPLQWRQLSSVLQMAMLELSGQTFRVDARWDSERKINDLETAAAAYAAGSPLEIIREALGQIDPNLLPPDNKQDLQNQITGFRRAQTQIKRGSSEQFPLPEKYRIGKTPYPLTVDGVEYELWLEPVTAKPNLNLLETKPLSRYLQYLGLTEITADELAKTIIDFRDADTVPQTTNSETRQILDDARYIAETRNGRIRDFADLSWLPGFSPGLILFLRQNFSLAGDDARVHLDYATPPLLAALADLTLPQVNAALLFEQKKNDPLYNQTLDQVLGTDDAKKWRAVAADAVMDNAPIALRLGSKTPGPMLHAVFFPETKALTNMYVE